MENCFLPEKECRFPLLDALAEETVRAGFVHLSSELEFYGVTDPVEITTAVESCLRVLRYTPGGSGRHFRRTFVWTPRGIRRVWMVSAAGWELLLERMAPVPSVLSGKRSRNPRRGKR